MMKKICIALLAACAVLPASAAFQYERINPNEGVGIKVNTSMTLHLNTQGTFAANVTGFGYYVLGGEEARISLDMNEIATKGTVELGEFRKGDKISFWMTTVNENGKESFLDSYHDNGRKDENRNAVYKGNNGKGNTSIIMGEADFGKGWSPGGDYSGAIDFVVSDVSEGRPSSGPNGQPLPGVLATLLLGGGILTGRFVLARRRR